MIEELSSRRYGKFYNIIELYTNWYKKITGNEPTYSLGEILERDIILRKEILRDLKRVKLNKKELPLLFVYYTNDNLTYKFKTGVNYSIGSEIYIQPKTLVLKDKESFLTDNADIEQYVKLFKDKGRDIAFPALPLFFGQNVLELWEAGDKMVWGYMPISLQLAVAADRNFDDVPIKTLKKLIQLKLFIPKLSLISFRAQEPYLSFAYTSRGISVYPREEKPTNDSRYKDTLKELDNLIEEILGL
jgi:hypothetical protein